MTGNVETITITAQAVYPANAGKKFGAVVDQTNNRFPATPDILAQISKGQTVTIEIGHQNWGGKPVQVINRVLDAAPRVQGTQALALPPADKDCRIFVCGFLQSLYQGTGTYPGADALMDIIYATRCAYEAAFAKPLRAPQGVQRTAPTPPGRQNSYQAHDPRDDERYDSRDDLPI